jgi:signal transduction histidine kinase
VRNGAAFLAETLDSLLAQTYADFELIICDNASHDGTRQICESYAARDERVRYLGSDVNHGAAWNYNRALRSATGRYFKWAAHDDLCAPTYLERCVEVLDRAPDSVVLTYPKTVMIDAEGNLLGPYEDGLDLRAQQPHQRLRTLFRNLVLSNAVFGLIRKDALDRTAGHGDYISADYVLLAELALQGQFWEIPEPLFLRREHPGTSRHANRTTAELAEWFKTDAQQRNEFIRLFTEHLGAIDRASHLSPRQRAHTYFTLFTWLRRFHRGVLRELARPLVKESPPVEGMRTHVTRANKLERIVVHDRIRATVWSVAPDYTPHVRIHVDSHLTIETDPEALDRVLVNLISNAVRYGGNPITITAEADPDFVLIVEDCGRGISRDFRPRIFEPFARSRESAHVSLGLGLGLAIARMSAEDCGGSLTCEPAARGARFRLTLPRPSDAADGGDRRPASGADRAQKGERATSKGWSLPVQEPQVKYGL